MFCQVVPTCSWSSRLNFCHHYYNIPLLPILFISQADILDRLSSSSSLPSVCKLTGYLTGRHISGSTKSIWEVHHHPPQTSLENKLGQIPVETASTPKQADLTKAQNK